MDNCPYCGNPITFMGEKNPYYCSTCGRYLPRGYKPNGEHEQVDGYEKGLKIGSLGYLSFSIVVFILFAYYYPDLSEGVNENLPILIVFYCVPLLLLINSTRSLLITMRVYITVVPEGIIKHNIFGKDTLVRWNEIDGVGVSLGFPNGNYTLKIKSGKKNITISPFIIGCKFANKVIEQVPESKLDDRAKLIIYHYSTLRSVPFPDL